MKILSIDFDIIMAPSINLYNDKVPQTDWTSLEEIPYYKLCTFDTIHYKRLTKYLIHQFRKKDKEQLYFFENHAMVAKLIENSSKKINLVNIDHHHDIEYANGPKANEHLTCANWVNYLYNINKIESYIWVNNPNSSSCEIEYSNFKSINFKDYKLEEEEFDIICLVLSEPWIPPYLRNLYFLWLDLAKEFAYPGEIDFTIP